VVDYGNYAVKINLTDKKRVLMLTLSIINKGFFLIKVCIINSKTKKNNVYNKS
jgi:hypothetical protein